MIMVLVPYFDNGKSTVNHWLAYLTMIMIMVFTMIIGIIWFYLNY